MSERPSDQPYYVKIKLDNDEQFIVKFQQDKVRPRLTMFSQSTVLPAKQQAGSYADRVRMKGYVAVNHHIYADEVHYPAHRIKEVHVCKDLLDD
jgi:hypothetical protein